MDKAVIDCTVVGSVLTILNTAQVLVGENEVTVLEFSFDTLWEAIPLKKIIFLSAAGVLIEPLTITGTSIDIPYEAMDKKGNISCTMIGYDGDQIKKTGIAFIHVTNALSNGGTVLTVGAAEENRVTAEEARVAAELLRVAAEGSRVTTFGHFMSSNGQSFGNFMGAANLQLYNQDVEFNEAEIARWAALKARSNNEVKEYLANLKLDYTSDFLIDGAAIVSSPESLIFMQCLGENGGAVIFDIIGTKGGYGISAGGNNEGLLSEYADIGYYPYILNRPNISEGRYGIARWKQVGKGFPSGILEYVFSADPKTAYSAAFVRDEVLYLIFDTSNINDLKHGLTLKSSEGTKNFSGGYEKPGDQGYIAVKDNTSGLWFVATCTTMNEYQVDTSPINVTVGLNEANNTVDGSACSIALGKDGVGSIGQVVFCFSTSMVKADAVSAAIAGLTNYDTKRAEAEADWAAFFDGLEESTIILPVAQRVKLYSCLREIRSLSYNGYLSAGLPDWYKNFVRDTSWAIIGLCSLGHTQSTELAESFVEFFRTIDSFENANSFTIDGKRCETTMNQTDSAATFLLAIGKLFETTGYIATYIKTAMDKALEYAQDNFADGHITCLHAHDFWDDYVSEVTTSDVKYESMVDVLWIAGLEAIAPVYTDLEDTARALFCTETAAALRASLEDFRKADGGLYYAIKTNDTMYDTLEALPGTLYAAWLLNDVDCTEWVLRYGSQLRARNGAIDLPMTHSKLLTDPLKEEIWMPYLPIVAMLASRAGDNRPVDELSKAFPFAGFPEYAKYTSSEELVWKSHAHSFAWAEAMYLILCADMFV